MCGINGFNFSDERLVLAMNRRVKHRGPDGDGIFVDAAVSLGHTRLAIIDLSEQAGQPMFSVDGNLALVFNGEIYNFQDLRRDLEAKGHQFRTSSDSEVILTSYREYGKDCLHKFNGIFAFAIYDKRDGSIFVARDRIGVKPLYYYWDGKKFIFSSEIKAILEHRIEKSVAVDAFNIYLRMLYVPAPLTMFAGIKKLEPASYLFYRDADLEQKFYWHPSDFSDISDRGEIVRRIQTLARDAVRLQMISDRPVGVFLSGGIDSTVITGLARDLSGSNQMKTFSIDFDIRHEKFNSDAIVARRTSRVYGTDHHEYVITGKDAAENLEAAVYHMDEPVANTTQVATYILSKYAATEVVVALGGDGGDELFGGYERYGVSRWISSYQKLPSSARRIFGLLCLNQLKHWWPAAGKLEIPTGVERYLSFMSQKETAVEKISLRRENGGIFVNKFFADRYFNVSANDFEKLFMWADVRSWLPDESLIRSDKMSMAFGLEQRVPLLDHRLVELSLRIPTRMKIKHGVGKSVFREAMKEYLPDFVSRQPKRGWFSPTSEWLRGDLRELARSVGSDSYSSGSSQFINFKNYNLMLDDHIARRAYNMNLIWAVITFQLWHKRFFS